MKNILDTRKNFNSDKGFIIALWSIMCPFFVGFWYMVKKGFDKISIKSNVISIDISKKIDNKK